MWPKGGEEREKENGGRLADREEELRSALGLFHLAAQQ